MRVEVLLFAQLRDAIGSDSVALEIDSETTVSQLATDLLNEHGAERFSRLPLRFAVDETFVDADHRLREGDCVAIIPPVSGG